MFARSSGSVPYAVCPGGYMSRRNARLVSWFAALVAVSFARTALAGEANLVLPDLRSVPFLGVSGWSLLVAGIVVPLAGLVFALVASNQLRRLPVHRSMREISELIYETCKTYLVTQGKFIAVLWVFIGAIIVIYFGLLQHLGASSVAIILAFSLVGILGSSGVAWFGMRVNTYANSRSAFAALAGKPFPTYAIPLKAGMSIGTLLISVELIIMLFILLFIPSDLAGPCFIGFAIGESLGASALRIAGGIFTKIADIGSDMMKIVFKIKEDDARNPGVIADCVGDNAGDSVGPSADGFETYGVTGVALISFILLAIASPTVQVQLLVWIFAMRIMMVIASVGSYWLNEAFAKARYGASEHDELRGAAHVARVAHLDRLGRPHLRRLVPPHPDPRRRHARGGSSRRSSPAGRSRAPSSPRWSRSSPPPSPVTCRRSSPPRARAAPR